MSRFSQNEVNSEITKKISFIGKNILMNDMRKVSCEKTIENIHFEYRKNHLESEIKKIFTNKLWSLKITT